MEEAKPLETCEFGDRITSDITVRLINSDRRPEWFYCHSSILKRKSKFFADRLSAFSSNHPSLDAPLCIEIQCSVSDYDHHVKILRLLYLPNDSVLDSCDSVKSALGVLQVAISLCCEEIAQSCIQYLEAVPWDEKEEEEILKIAPHLGPEAMHILARLHPVNQTAAKNVIISAIRFATSLDESFPPFTDELKTSAQEQIEYMLSEDEDAPLVMADADVKAVMKTGLFQMFSAFETALNRLPSGFVESPEATEQKVLQSLLDIEWMCSILPKLDMMKDFVMKWVDMSNNVLAVVQDEKLESGIWVVKAKLMSVVGKVLEAVGYGNVILPATSRVQFLKIWLPYIRKIKPLLDLKGAEDESFMYKMDSDLCQSIEGAVISLVLALPSNDQAEILTDWMNTEQLIYPDLSEAFEVWCYRTKSAKSRLVVGFDGVGNPTVSL
ncbi:BTB/POZ domain-containing protein [Acorus calamus]|uniref:BTB/POZ domain-containing protein n=1 Tax=Acorus calamus TaxID=4465 RepID=A0AAV9DVK3_ACOCL|nr:BTB/POZ domain-containing protein [Acorus calamus]